MAAAVAGAAVADPVLSPLGAMADEAAPGAMVLEAGFGATNTTKGVAWSPDGTCLLTSTEDHLVRLFEVPDAVLDGSAGGGGPWRETFACAEGETVYDYAWYPLMHSGDPATCVFASSSRDHPVHLWDAFTGACRGTLVGRNHLDEVAATYSLAFSADGAKLYGGGDRTVRVFDATSLWGACVDRPTCASKKGDHGGLKGLIGAVATDPTNAHVYAAGSYRGGVAVYDDREPPRGPALRVCKDKPMGGVTRLKFDGRGRLWSGHRAETGANAAVRGFDLAAGRVAARCRRDAPTHQRLDFDVQGDAVVVAGGRARTVDFFDAEKVDATGACSRYASLAVGDATNGAAFHPHRPLVGVATGERTFPGPPPDSSDDDDDGGTAPPPSANRVAVLRAPTRPGGT